MASRNGQTGQIEMDQICHVIINSYDLLRELMNHHHSSSTTYRRKPNKSLQIRNANYPQGNRSFKRPYSPNDNDLQTFIRKNVGTTIQNDTNIEHTEYSKHPSQDSNKEKHFEKKRCSCQSNQNANRQTAKPSTSRETMIDRGNPRCGLNALNKKPASLPNLCFALPSDETSEKNAKSSIEKRGYLRYDYDSL